MKEPCIDIEYIGALVEYDRFKFDRRMEEFKERCDRFNEDQLRREEERFGG